MTDKELCRDYVQVLSYHFSVHRAYTVTGAEVFPLSTQASSSSSCSPGPTNLALLPAEQPVLDGRNGGYSPIFFLFLLHTKSQVIEYLFM